MSLKFIVFCLAVGTTFAAEPHCCMSKKFSAKMLIVTATLKSGSSSPTMTQNQFALEQDMDSKRQAVNGSYITANATGEYTDDYMVLRDFEHMRTYSYNDTHCHVDPIIGEELRRSCVPAPLMHTGNFTMGSGNQMMHINGWFGKIGNQTWTWATTVNDCTFVSFTRFGTEEDGTQISQSAQFVDVVQYHNSYDEVFTIPGHCKAAAANVG